MTVSFKILRFNLFVNSFLDYIFSPEGITRYGWTTIQVSAGTDFRDKWNGDMKPYVNPLGNGHAAVEVRRALRK